MATSNEGLNRAYGGIAGTVTHMSMHDGDPGTTGANELSAGTAGYARVAQTYGAPTAGAGDLAAPAVFNVSGGDEVTHWGAWDESGDNPVYLFGEELTVPQAFATDGTYTLNTAPYSAANPS